MTIEVRHWLPCETCGGTCRVEKRLYPHLDMNHYHITFVPCTNFWCIGGRELRRMTKEEKRAMAEQILKETSDVPENQEPAALPQSG